ncbi:MAG TPA: glycosyltransferase family 1 protein [Geobacteraceae bacterium]|nr:glycosyltransferase family 1 protein [Geobacteraceae bacterium]
MKICIDARPLQNANRTRGPGIHLTNVLQQMGRLDQEDEFILVTQKGKKLPPLFRKESRVETFRPDRPNRFNWMADHLLLPSLVKRSGAKVFLATDFNSYLVPPPRVKVVSIVYDVIPLLFPEVMAQQPLSIRVGWPLNFRKLKQSDALIAISAATRDDAVKVLGLDPERITVVYPAVNHDLFNPACATTPAVWEGVRQRYGIEGNYLLYVGDVDWRKNLARVLEAFATTSPSIRLVLAGKKARDYPPLLDQIRVLGLEKRVILTGFVPDEALPFLYGHAQALVFPSLYEGFGLPIVEAMACGCPVITSSVSSMPEVAGDAALLVDPKSVAEIAAALKLIVEDQALRERLRDDGIRQAARFSWEQHVTEVLAVLRKVAG